MDNLNIPYAPSKSGWQAFVNKIKELISNNKTYTDEKITTVTKTASNLDKILAYVASDLNDRLIKLTWEGE